MADDDHDRDDDEQDRDDEQQDGEDKGAGDIEAELEQRRERMKELEKDPPGNTLDEWPDDDLKYETFGGGEGDHGYEEGPEVQLGPSEVRYFEDGRVEVAGKEVDDPDEFKSEPIPGGPTDPNAPDTK